MAVALFLVVYSAKGSSIELVNTKTDDGDTKFGILVVLGFGGGLIRLLAMVAVAVLVVHRPRRVDRDPARVISKRLAARRVRGVEGVWQRRQRGQDWCVGQAGQGAGGHSCNAQ